jgi:hypothetical protein
MFADWCVMPGRSRFEHFLFWRILVPSHILSAWRTVKADWLKEYRMGRGW